MKIGRNDICPCGSGKKFKKCHLGVAPNILIPRPIVPLPKLPPDLLRRAREAFEKQRTNETKRIETFGKIRPIMHAAAFGDHIVSVGARLYRMPQRSTFTNFLLTYGLSMLGDEWCETQSHLSDEEQHPLAALHCRANEFLCRQPVQPEGYVTVVPNGPLAFCKRFYYDLYIVDNNNELRDDLLHRLRHKEHFQAAAHELFVEASCLRAGFSISPKVLLDRNPKMSSSSPFTRRPSSIFLSRPRAVIALVYWDDREHPIPIHLPVLAV